MKHGGLSWAVPYTRVAKGGIRRPMAMMYHGLHADRGGNCSAWQTTTRDAPVPCQIPNDWSNREH